MSNLGEQTVWKSITPNPHIQNLMSFQDWASFFPLFFTYLSSGLRILVQIQTSLGDGEGLIYKV